jgi:tyrosine-protein kinase Etk/Wzc
MKNFQDLSIGDYLYVLRRRIWYFIVTTIVAGAGAGIYIWQMPSVYKSETTVLVADRLLPEDYIGSIVRDSVSARIDFVRQQLQSRTFLERIVQEFQLARGGPEELEAAVGRVLRNTEITVFSTNSLRLAYYETDPNLAHAVARRLAETVIQLNESFRNERVMVADQFLDEQLRLAETELAEAELKLEQFEKQHFARTPGSQDPAVGNLATLQAQLFNQQSELENSRDQRISIQRRLEEQRRLKMVMTSRVPAVVRQDMNPAEQALQQQLTAKRAEFEAISSKYTAFHPDVIRAARETQEIEMRLANHQASIEGNTERVVVDMEPEISTDVIAADFEAAEIQLELDQANREVARREQAVNETNGKIRALQARLNPRPEVNQELTVLVRDHEAAKQQYSYLSSRKANAQLAASVDTYERNETFKIVDEANLPIVPISPNRPLLASVSVVASLLLGLGFAFMREYFAPSLNNEEEAFSELKLPILSSISEFKLRPVDRKPVKLLKGKRSHAHSVNNGTFNPFNLNRADDRIRKMLIDPFTPVGEQFRIIRARLTALQKERALKTILITSSIPGEGKTFAACSLAAILAREKQKRVLLIDADLRTGNARKVLGVSSESPARGLADFLRGTGDPIALHRSILHCTECGFDFLPAGEHVDDASELLISSKFEALIHDLAPSFDWIIIDSTPVIGLADATLVIPVCDATILVARAGKTPTKLIQNSIERIGRNRIGGVLLNRVNRLGSSLYGHGYSQYYRRSKSAVS